ncbi:hypothetical protein ACPPVO_47485 [Dactylosporangium sp. McL0621]|uniref:hypothetical protein n=1 Tax=Dactylosporangium sp. McL0621 TaxID=3415678 RepID=UPI003CF41347
MADLAEEYRVGRSTIHRVIHGEPDTTRCCSSWTSRPPRWARRASTPSSSGTWFGPALAARTGAVTVIVSHRFSTVAGADLILVLDRGRLVEQGAHEELLAAGGRYAELYAIQAIAYTG